MSDSNDGLEESPDERYEPEVRRARSHVPAGLFFIGSVWTWSYYALLFEVVATSQFVLYADALGTHRSGAMPMMVPWTNAVILPIILPTTWFIQRGRELENGRAHRPLLSSISSIIMGMLIWLGSGIAIYTNNQFKTLPMVGLIPIAVCNALIGLLLVASSALLIGYKNRFGIPE